MVTCNAAQARQHIAVNSFRPSAINLVRLGEEHDVTTCGAVSQSIGSRVRSRTSDRYLFSGHSAGANQVIRFHLALRQNQVCGRRVPAKSAVQRAVMHRERRNPTLRRQQGWYADVRIAFISAEDGADL